MTATLTPAEAMERLEQVAHRATAEESAAKAMQQAKTRLLLSKDAKAAFFATLALRLKYQPDWTVDTAATDGRRIVYNPDFVLALPEAERIGLLAHEVLHVVNRHFARMTDRKPEDWNIACDLAINPILIDAGFMLPDCGIFPGQEPYDKFPIGLAAEEYYAKLQQPQQDQDQPSNTGDDSDDGQNSSGPGSPGDDGEPSDQPGQAPADPGKCGGVMAPTDDNGQPLDPAAMSQLEAEVKINVASAQQVAEKRGTMPGGLERLIAGILAPAIDWRQALRDYLVPAARDYSWKRPSRRHIHRRLIMPSLRSLELGEIVAVIDTSGSITDDTLQRFASELDDIARQGTSKITIVYHDSEVVKVETWTPDEGPLTLTPCGGGGTDHRPVFAWLDEQETPPAIVVCLTDLASDFPEEAPQVPVLWASTDSRANHPFGDRINITAD